MAVVKPIDVMIVVRGVAYPLAERRQGTTGPLGRGVLLGYEAVVAQDNRMLLRPDEMRAHGGRVVASLEAVHTARCWAVERRWSAVARKKVRGDCDCGAEAAMSSLLATGRV